MLADEGQLRMFAQNMYLLIGALICLGALAILVFLAWTGTKMGIWHLRRQRAEVRYRRQKLGGDGTPLPPTARGLCAGCQRVFDRVYHLPSGQRLCPECYGQSTDEGTKPDRDAEKVNP